MKKVLAFAGSNSSTSINQKLVNYVVSKLENTNTKTLELGAYKIPMYSEDVEKNEGFPIAIQELKNEIAACDGLIVSVNEHNGGLSAFFKNVLDWLSRVDRNFLANKKVLLMSTSPGGRGAAGALDYAKSSFPRYGATIVESFSFASFYDNFDVEGNTIKDPSLALGIQEVIASFLQEIQ